MEMSYEESKKLAYKGLGLLAVVTIIEVIIALLGNGHLIAGLTFPTAVMIPIMIGLSLYKAYFIVKEFMHLGHETRSMAASVVLPTLLLVWAIIAFLWEGDSWKQKREYVKDRGQEPANEEIQGNLMRPADEVPTQLGLR